ncbi:MAG: TonB-dependent receptor, partial [Opitutaceae bacterium]|nr:TonB-dependent receptor [Opitutaceae bacterium]
WNPDWSTDWFSWADLRSKDTAGGRARRDSYSLSDDRTVGYAAIERMFMFDRRLILMAGLRHDKVYYESRSVPAYSDGDWTRSLGCNWNPYGDNRLVVFGNYSTSCNTELTVDNGTHTVMPMETGRGLETGARAALFHGKLNLTASAFQIEKHNMPQNNPDYYFEGTGTPEYTSTGVHRVRGADMELLCKPFAGLRVLVTAAYLDAKVVESTDIRYPVGSRKIRTPDKTLSLALSYKFPGLLRGFSASARMSYRSGYVDSNYIAASSVTPGENNAEQLYYFAPSLTLFGGSLKYDWKRKKTAQTISLTASNLLDKRYAGTTRNLGIGRQITLGYSVTFR